MRKALLAFLLFVTPAWAHEVAGLYNRVYYRNGEAVPTSSLELRPDGKIMENGVHTANWKVVDKDVLVTILDARYGTAKLKVGPGQLEGYNVHKNGDKFKWVLTKTEKATGNATVKIRFIFRCSATGEVYNNIALNSVTLIRGGQTATAKIDNQTAIFESMPPATKWRMQAVYDGNKQVSIEVNVDNRLVQDRTCTVDS